MIETFLILAMGLFLGIGLSKWMADLQIKQSHKREIAEKNGQYKQILEKLNTKKTRFKTRVNNTVYIGVKLDDFGKVDILYLIDKRDVLIFQGEKCLYTSKNIDNALLEEVIQTIEKVHYTKIIDVVNFFGFNFYRPEFEKKFNVNLEELKQKANTIMMPEKSDVDKIITKNSRKLDIDEILDKINREGINQLTQEELEFLNKFGK